MPKKQINKPFNGGQWTQARYNSFITSLLRAGTRKWGPKNVCKKNAKNKAKEIIIKNKEKFPMFFAKNGNYKTGPFFCASCKTIQPNTIEPPEGSKSKKKKIDNCVIDHIEPIVDPAVGFTTWDDWIRRCFCEVDMLQCVYLFVCFWAKGVKLQREVRITTDRLYTP